ncbi:hypothetical protein [Microbacterium dextranolyticum]|uniref:Uncharacterized protein n=1 Tax=Microbacterium dextranolyticum TaxID=36806 RepID=A0A9W6HMA1_9MICO|nr:hypothetical protein [Microbacterium dextranolyticum]MBM7464133.1 hypothetical protein [Microbacterium dextranolyticum]GLJ95128.1 hypothetical protein GCM10017591_11900 [Microbacterium dextranolyticum]
MILTLIVACEVGFWMAILTGLVVRYPLRRPRLGAALLVSAPVIDVVLLVLVATDLLRGGTASWQHGVAAIYIGFSVAFGHRVIAWADVRFAHRFAGGPAPVRLAGVSYTVACWKDVARTGLMVVIAGGLTWGLIVVANDPVSTAELLVNARILGVILVVDVVWALSYTIWPKRSPRASAAVES